MVQKKSYKGAIQDINTEVLHQREITMKNLQCQHEGPLDMWLVKTVRRDETNNGVVAIQMFAKTSRDQVLQRYTTLDHRGLVTVFEIFLTDDTNKHIHVVSEYLPFCLDHVVASGRCPTDGQLALIMAQVIPIAHLFTSILLITDNSRFSMRSLICIQRVSDMVP